MPDQEGNPTDAQLERELGWLPLASEAEPEVAPEQAPEPKLAVEAKPAPVAAAAVTPVGPDPLVVARTELRTQQTRAAITQAALSYKQTLISQGASEEDAHDRAEAKAGEYWANFQLNESRDRENESAKQSLMKELSGQHGVPAALLAGFSDPESMRAAAALYGAQAKEIADLKVKTATPKVAVQSFDIGGGQGGGAKAAQQIAYATGKSKSLSAAEFEAIFGYNPL